MFLFNLNKYLELEWLSQMVSGCLTVWEFVDSFPKWLHHFRFPSAVKHMDSSSPISLPTIGVVSILNKSRNSITTYTTKAFFWNFYTLSIYV